MVTTRGDRGSNNTGQNQQTQNTARAVPGATISGLAVGHTRSNRRGHVSGRHYPQGSPQYESWRTARNKRQRDLRERKRLSRLPESEDATSEVSEQEEGPGVSFTQDYQDGDDQDLFSDITLPLRTLGSGTPDVEDNENQDIVKMVEDMLAIEDQVTTIEDDMMAAAHHADAEVFPERRYTYPDPTVTRYDLFMASRQGIPWSTLPQRTRKTEK